jgi:hypothetical protein
VLEPDDDSELQRFAATVLVLADSESHGPEPWLCGTSDPRGQGEEVLTAVVVVEVVIVVFAPLSEPTSGPEGPHDSHPSGDLPVTLALAVARTLTATTLYFILSYVPG